jgi:anti-anti-sigma factor
MVHRLTVTVMREEVVSMASSVRDPRPGRVPPGAARPEQAQQAQRAQQAQQASTGAITIDRNSGAVRVAAAGELDLAVWDELHDALMTTLRSGSTVELVVDLAAATFLDAGTVAVLLRARDAARRIGTPLRVVNPRHPMVRQVLELTGTLHELTAPDGR